MRNLSQPFQSLALAGLAALLLACSSTPTYNPTTFPYEINEELAAKGVEAMDGDPLGWEWKL